VPSNWNTGAVPGPSDDAVIPFTGITVTHSTGSDLIHSLTSQGVFVLSGGSLSVAATVLVDNTFTLSGGTLANATVEVGTTITAAGTTATLSGVTLEGDLDMANESGVFVNVVNGLTLDGTARLGTASGSTFGLFLFGGVQTLGGSGTVLFGGSVNNLMQVNAGATLTLGPDLTVRGSSGTLGNAGTVINQGTIAADTARGTLTVSGSGWSNAGTLEALNGATLILTSNWSNIGLISETDATLNLGGTFTTAGLGTYSRSGGTINLTGTLDNTSSTVALDDTTGPWNLRGGTLVGGTVSEAGNGVLVATTQAATLSGVTLEGDLDMANESGVFVNVVNGLTLDGMARLGTASGSTFGLLLFGGVQTLGGSGTVLFGGSVNNLMQVNAGATLTLGPDLTVRGSSGTLGNAGTIINQGTIAADTAGGTLTVSGNSWVNSGTLEALRGAILILTGSNWSNAGLISVTDATLNLAGTFTMSAGSSFSRGGGTINITGTLDNTDSALALDDTTGSWNLAGGTITFGTVSEAGSAQLVPTGLGGRLIDVTLDGDLNLVASSSVSFTGTINGNMVNAGQLTIGGSAATGFLTISGTYTQTASGSLGIRIGGVTPGGQFDQLNVSGSVTLDGVLNVSLVVGYTPDLGDSFQILTFGSRTGDFAFKNGLDLGGGLRLDPQYDAGSLTLVTVPHGPSVGIEDWRRQKEEVKTIWLFTSAFCNLPSNCCVRVVDRLFAQTETAEELFAVTTAATGLQSVGSQ
jgi:hypothetical protein